MNDTPSRQDFRFNQENARAMAARSWQARRERKAKLEAEAAEGRQAIPQCERLALQIQTIQALMVKSKDADELQKLSSALGRVFRIWQILSETPNPGSRKPPRSKARSVLNEFAPE